MKTFLIIDGNAIIHRAFHALPPLTAPDGTPTNAIYGFFSMLHKVIVDYQPTNLVICFDTPKPTFRNKMFKEYQAHRPRVDDTLIPQFPYIKEIVDSAGITRIEKDGYEADDLIGSIAKKFKNKAERIIILTGDKDILQLVDNNVFVLAPLIGLAKTVLYDKKNVEKKLGVTPNKIPDFKALVGDSSDNYKGAKGIGPKTAIKLLSQFGTIDNVLKSISKIKDERTREIIKTHIENIKLSHELATIMTNMKIDLMEEKTRLNPIDPNMKIALQKLSLYALIKRFFPEKKVEIKTRLQKPKSETKEPQLDLFS